MGKEKALSHVLGYLFSLLASSKLRQQLILENEYYRYRKGCPQVIPQLRASPFWPIDEFPWVKELEGHILEIQEEFFNLRKIMIQELREGKRERNALLEENSLESHLKSGFQKYKSSSSSASSSQTSSNSTDKGCWNVCYFYLNGLVFEENIAHCPKTIQAIKYVFISLLQLID